MAITMTMNICSRILFRLEFQSMRYFRENSHNFGRGRQLDFADCYSNSYQNFNNITQLLNAYRRFGHICADLDPLNLRPRTRVPELEPKLYGFDAASLKKELRENVAANGATLEDYINYLEYLYCGRISIEFMHLNCIHERRWVAENFENIRSLPLLPVEKLNVLKVMLQAKAWELFIAQKFPTLKRYSGEGSESVIGLYKVLLEDASNYNIRQFIFGGAHRGRLSIQTVLFNFPPNQLFRKIRGMSEFPANVQGVGDVLTHQRSHFDYTAADGDTSLHVCALPNPSHLEDLAYLKASLPMALGKARGKASTLRLGDYCNNGKPGDGILCVNHHGDGAFAGQGIVWESINISQVPHFRIGGSMHIVINNQIAFTAEQTIGRSSYHVTDMAKAIDSPIIHINGDDVEMCLFAAKFALAYRDMFRKDIFIDVICYRKYGHNELDDPTFTNPAMYEAIKAKKSVVDEYTKKMHAEGVFSLSDSKNFVDEYNEFLTQELNDVDSGKSAPIADHLGGSWKEFEQAPPATEKWDTGVDLNILTSIGLKSVEYPDEFKIHPNVKRTLVDSRRKRFGEGASNSKVDWATAEALAFGTILLDGSDVRISGQDVGRGTFSNRHAMFVDQKTDLVHIPLNNISQDQKNFLEIANSPLSEASILGFEYGFSIDNPRRLVVWEAQFGDFYNAAQVQIDTLIASGESKWLLQSGIVIVLPHGFDGAGPDHSSSHVERFLQLTDSREAIVPADGSNVNMFVANPTTSAQYFHLLRRQIITPYRKPLIIISPKLLLRHSLTLSGLIEFGPGTHFKTVLGDSSVNSSEVKKIVFTSGKHAVILSEARDNMALKDVAIVRLEELCPFPVQDLQEMLKLYSNARTFVWSQEEPRNAGPWSFVAPRFKNAFGVSLEYVGRSEFAHMATSIEKLHKEEARKIIFNTLGI